MKTYAKWAGIVVQSAVLGTLLFWALVELYSATSDMRIFRYQAF